MPNEAACFPVTQIPLDGRSRLRLGHDGLPLAFGSLCARLAAFHFEIKAEMNADDPCESPAERPSCPSEPRTFQARTQPSIPAAAAQRRAGVRLGLLVAVGVQTCF